LQIRLTRLIVFSVMFTGILVGLAFLYAFPVVCSYASTLGQGSLKTDEAMKEFGKALVVVREAEAAGAEERTLRRLVEQLNVAVSLIDRAENLQLQGDVDGATAQAERSIQTSRETASQALQLRDEASQRAYYGRLLTFAMAPIASTLLTIAVHYSWKRWRRSERDRMMGMVIKRINEPKEEA